MTSFYCTLADARRELKAELTVGDNALFNFIRQVSGRIDEQMGSLRKPFFLPLTTTRNYTIKSTRINSWENTFLTNEHMLALTTVVRGGTTITSVELYSDDNEVPIKLRLTDSGISWYSCSTPPQKVNVTGVFGWHEDYDNAYDSVDALAAEINATVTSMTVADIDGVDLDGITPRISAGNYIKLEDELVLVTATDTDTNIATIRRAQLGTTAAVHVITTPTEVFNVDWRVNRVAARQAALLYVRLGAFQVETLDGVGVVTYPQDLLMELQATLTGFVYV